LDDFPELVAADSCDCADPSVAESLCNLEKTGKQQYEAFVEDVLVKRTKSISDTIKKNKLSLFKQPGNSNPSKQGKQIAALKNDVSIFSQLYRPDKEISEIFSHMRFINTYHLYLNMEDSAYLVPNPIYLNACHNLGKLLYLTTSTARF
jgi:hypothetical protein